MVLQKFHRCYHTHTQICPLWPQWTVFCFFYSAVWQTTATRRFSANEPRPSFHISGGILLLLHYICVCERERNKKEIIICIFIFCIIKVFKHLKDSWERSHSPAVAASVKNTLLMNMHCLFFAPRSHRMFTQVVFLWKNLEWGRNIKPSVRKMLSLARHMHLSLIHLGI